ncbi:MAG: M23 family metallopeptidase [Pseudomonadota bacterium]
MHRMIAFALGLLPFWASSSAANGKEVCASNTLCIETVRRDNAIDFFAINKKVGLPISGKVSLTLKNMRVINGKNDPFVLAGSERRKLFALRVPERGAWKYNYRFSWARGDFTAKHDTSYAYRLPYAKGTAFRISQGCNGKFSHFGSQRYAVDFSMKIGTPIHAARGGIVVDVKEDSNKGGPSRRFREEANVVSIQHDDRTLGMYFHLKQNGAAVEIGDRVKAGDLIGYSGNTGFSSGPHLHFAVTKANKSISEEISLPIFFQTRLGQLRCPNPGTRLVAQ